MPMRFADLDGSLIDCYQVTTQMTDESGQAYPPEIDALLNKATGSEGYYGVFCANMHTDAVFSTGSDAIVNAAKAKQIPVVSAKQMLEWIDARNNSTFSNYSWSNNQLGFAVTQDAKALNLKAMLPRVVAAGSFVSLTRNGSAATTTTEVIKGIEYVFFDATNGNYNANYGGSGSAAAKNVDLIAEPSLMKIVPPQVNALQVNALQVDALQQNSPNPSSGVTSIAYSIAKAGPVKVWIVDLYGRTVRIVENTIHQPGSYSIQFNAASLSKGVYYYKMEAGNFKAIRKMIVQ